jgi:hypothetical protein
VEDSTLNLERSSMHVTLTQDQLLAFTRHIQSTNTGRPTEESVHEFVQRLHTAQIQTFSQVMQEFQLRQKPSALIDLAENEQEQGCIDDPNVRVEEEGNKWPYAKPAVYVVYGCQMEEALNCKPHRGKRGSRRSKKSQGQDVSVTPVDSNEISAISNNGKETVEERISQGEAQVLSVTPVVLNNSKVTVASAVQHGDDWYPEEEE